MIMMKNRKPIVIGLLFMAGLLLAVSCEKESSNNGQFAVLTTTDVIAVTNSTATCGGDVTSSGSSVVTVRGICWSKNTTPTVLDSSISVGFGEGPFTWSLTGLTPNTIYYLRAYATNSSGTAYGRVVSFTTLQANEVTDIDGNIYHTVTIGLQVWMVENLKVSHYRNGDAIPDITNASEWGNQANGAYCDYSNSPGNSTIYGRLYNWYAVTDPRNICPSGWHVPTDDEWTILMTYLGVVYKDGNSNPGGLLKEAGTAHWTTPNTGATNETGFTALPGGMRDPNGQFFLNDTSGYWWSSTSAGIITHTRSDNAEARSISNASGSVTFSKDLVLHGYSLRCIKD